MLTLKSKRYTISDYIALGQMAQQGLNYLQSKCGIGNTPKRNFLKCIECPYRRACDDATRLVDFCCEQLDKKLEEN